MSKLGRKFFLGLSAILLLVTLFSLYLNANVIERYLRYREKQELGRVCTQLSAADSDLAGTIARLEEQEDVVIAWAANSPDNVLLNERLRDAFLKKGLGLGEYWLWAQDQQDAQNAGGQLRTYYKPKLHYNLMVQYLDLGANFVAVAKIIPAMDSTISLINLVTALVFSGAAVVMLALIWLLTRRITVPLHSIGQAARSIAALDFCRVEVHTHDELETLAEDINHMSGKLEAAHRELAEKNRQMEELLSNVSHDLKTPVSLIKAYTVGMQDGLDDGTFLDTIVLQNQRMEQLIERLIQFQRQSRRPPQPEPVALDAVLQEALTRYQLPAQNRGLAFCRRVDLPVTVTADREALCTMVDNLLSNAVKYGYGTTITAALEQRPSGPALWVENDLAPGELPDLERLWEPFYVGEQSRNQALSGTGLGLAIVRQAAAGCCCKCTCAVAEGKIRFTIQW